MIRWAVRLVLLVVALLLVLGGPLPDVMAKAVPALSPLAVLSASIAHRGWYANLLWTAPALLVLVSALWKGRWFCRWICPLGTVISVPSQVSFRRRLLRKRINGTFFWFIVGASAAGLPLLLFLDPLSTFTRLGVLAGRNTDPWGWIAGALIPAVMLLALIQPQVWCTHLCPLGYFLETVRVRGARRRFQQGRRDVLRGLLLGVPAAFLVRRFAKATGNERPVMPPGAKGTDNFAATCERCYACVEICPTRVIRIRQRTAGIAEWYLPEMDFNTSYCEEFCNKCTQVCPTGALRPLTEEQKRMRKIGTARVIREQCLGWAEQKHCMLCDEFCPYNAVLVRKGKNDVPKPVVDPDVCRGCGACQNVCPVEGKAIVIDPTGLQGIAKEYTEVTGKQRRRRDRNGGRRN
ncbi:4Fe-4S binding protein [Kiritimatiella glycovorans]|nr:4Fe-4S binding protein [Kiritimatiella glycovorans]